MFECRTFITVKEIAEVLGVSESKSYGIVRVLNKELADKGYMDTWLSWEESAGNISKSVSME